jgi:hypothetical protein
MDEIIKEIRFRLRKAMNGITSASMRSKGITYKLNFGVALPEIKAIAADFTPDATLARWLWEQDVREHKILATLLFPPAEFSEQDADTWISEIRYPEIVEQFCTNLAQHLSFAPTLAERWIRAAHENTQVAGFLLYARLYSRGIRSLPPEPLLAEARKVMDGGVSRPQRAALLALKRYGRLSPELAASVLRCVADYQTADSPELREFYDDLRFEFAYYAG